MSTELIAIITAAVLLGGLVTAQIAGIRTSIRAVETKLDDRMHAGFRRLDECIGAVNDRVGAVETKLGERIGAVETKLGERIEAVETKLDTRLRGVEAELGTRIRAVETELAFLRGLMQGAGVGPIRQPEPPADEGTAA